MNKTIIVSGQPDTLVIDPTTFAYKDGVIYDVWETSKSYMAGCCIGRVKYVLNEAGEQLAMAWPMLNFTNDFERLSMDKIQWCIKVADAYAKFQP